MKTAKRFLYLSLAIIMICVAFPSCKAAGVDYIVLDENFGEEFYGIGFRLDDNALTLKIQSLIDEMISDGTFAEISDKWFGKDVTVKDAAYSREIKETGDGSLDYILNKGKLILGLDETFPPMGFRDAAGEIVGFDVDLAKEVCSRLGVELVLQPIEWSAKELELNSKSIDCIWNGMTITSERSAAMNISKPYIANRQVITVAADSGIAGKADLAGKIVATQSGSAALDAINADPDLAATFSKITEYASFDDAYLDLKAGSVDVLVIDEVYIRYVIEKDS